MDPDGGPGGFEAGYTAADGVQLRVALADAALVPFAEMRPSRRIKARKGQRHLPGLWWAAAGGRHVVCESWLERDQVMWPDWGKFVTGIASQPFRLSRTGGEGNAQASCGQCGHSAGGQALSGGAAGKSARPGRL